MPTKDAVTAKAGDVMYFDALEHAGEFTGASEARALIVELK